MGKIFDLDGPVMGVLGRITDVLVLNLIFIVTCIPIVTIGPALTSLYTVTLKMVKNEDSYIFKSYFSAFKDNFKISFFAWLIILVLLVVFSIDYRIVITLGSDLGEFFPILFLALNFICFLITLYLFPYIARFENTLKVSFKNVVLIMLASVPWTFLLVLITGGAVVASVFVIPLQYTILIWLLFGFALLAYAQSFVFRKVFAKYEPQEDDTKSKEMLD